MHIKLGHPQQVVKLKYNMMIVPPEFLLFRINPTEAAESRAWLFWGWDQSRQGQFSHYD